MSAVRVYPDAAALARAAAEQIAAIAGEAIATGGRFSIALSGGSTPRAVYTLLASAAFAGRVDWARAHLFFGDERCVPPDHADSNYRMASETLLNHIAAPPDQVHRIRGELSPPTAAAEYEQVLREFVVGSAAPRLDLILLGMGADGHTASLFPGAAALRETERWVVAVEHTQPPPPLVARVTITPPVLAAAAHVVFLVSGADKAERLRLVLTGPDQPDILPAQLARPSNGTLLWLVDAPAASSLGGENQGA
ncbi:MAG: 6-phosphogluconolactonase [Chloroflexi bacterium]|nr:6-phosphogluconolactonase [Chloroflexota bacterium]MBI3733540.1 6-phosphogluconolactonase [Chloroflexota bacterium]